MDWMEESESIKPFETWFQALSKNLSINCQHLWMKHTEENIKMYYRCSVLGIKYTRHVVHFPKTFKYIFGFNCQQKLAYKCLKNTLCAVYCCAVLSYVCCVYPLEQLTHFIRRLKWDVKKNLIQFRTSTLMQKEKLLKRMKERDREYVQGRERDPCGEEKSCQRK